MGKTSSFSQMLSHFRSKNAWTQMTAKAYFCYCNCSVQNPSTWSLGFFKSSFPVSYNTRKAEDYFQPSGLLSLSIPVFSVCMILNIALALWRIRLVTTIYSSSHSSHKSVLPWLFLLSHTLHIFVSDPEWCWSWKWARSEAQSATGAEEGCGTG